MQKHLARILLSCALAAGGGVCSVQAQVSICCFGDSITWGRYVTVPYPTRLANNTGHSVTNAGIPGETSGGGLSKIDALLKKTNPALILIMFGTNDINNNHNLRDAANTVIQIALTARAYGAVPIVATVPPTVGPRAYQMPKVNELNGYIRSYASANNILLADVQSAFGSGAGLFVSDGFHPNDSGAEVIARTFAGQIYKSTWLTPVFAQLPDVGTIGQSFRIYSRTAWTATANQPWIGISSGTSGTTNGTVIYTVAGNVTGAGRTGTISVASSGGNRTFTVKQAAPTLTVSPGSLIAPGIGAVGRQVAVVSHLPWTAVASDPSWIHVTSGASGTTNGTVVLTLSANAGYARVGTLTVSIGGLARTVAINQWPASTWSNAPAADFDGNFMTDPAVFQAASGNWRVSFVHGVQWLYGYGWSAVVPVPADYDGDGLVDFGVYHPASGNWYLLHSSDGQATVEPFGWSATIPLPGDYDGDGLADLAVFHQKTATWYFRYSGGGPDASVAYGWSAVVPVPADYDGDGITDLAVYHPQGAAWYVLESSSGHVVVQALGGAKALPVPADYDGDGQTDLAVYVRSTAKWEIAYRAGGTTTNVFGWSAVVPVPADYDGDGLADIAVYHPAGGTWYVQRSSDGVTATPALGGADQIPVLQNYRVHAWYKML